MHVLYRISSNSYQKERLTFATKEYCLSNFVDNVLTSSDKMTIIADCVNNELRETIDSYKAQTLKFFIKNLVQMVRHFVFKLTLPPAFQTARLFCFRKMIISISQHAGRMTLK